MSDAVDLAPRSRVATRQRWAERMARFPASGLSVAAFCAAEGISTNAFFYWKRQFATAPPPASEVPPRLLPVRLQPAAAVELVLPGGAVLRLLPGCDLAFVRSLLEALAGAPC